MSLLSASDMAGMRAEIIASFDLTAQVLRNAPTRDVTGGDVDDWTVVHSYPCRVEEAKVLPEAVAAGRVEAVTLYPIILPWNADVGARDRLTVAGTTYEVRGMDLSPSDNLDQTAICTLLS